MHEENRSFESLALGFHQQLLVHPNPADKTIVFSCSLIGCLGTECLLIHAPDNGVFPLLSEGQRLVIRTFLDDGIALFHTTVLYVSDIPAIIAYLDYPQNIQFRRLRTAKRVAIAQPILVNNLTHPAHQGLAGKLIDISTGGGRLRMFDKLGQTGDVIEVKGKFTVQGISRLLTLKACIRQCSGNDYGIQFIETDEDKLLILMGFIFNAQMTGTIEPVR